MFVYGAFMQRSFDDLGTPLADVTFCVVDLETTGSSREDGITEVGAIKVRGGQCLGTFHTLVNPGRLVPPEITVLTGITEAMVRPAPRIDAVLPAWLEFSEGTVIVGHNVRFDLGFLNSALERHGWNRHANPSVDTCALARRLVRDEVPNCRLGTLASRFRLDHQPSHRALDDALATCDLLHLLLERAASFGVLGLDDLLALPRLGGHPQVAKLRLANDLPRSAGVYLFEGHHGEVLYVGKATNLRQRVRSYFSGDERRSIGPLLREAQHIRHVACRSTLEAAVTELRLIQQLQPRYNRVGRRATAAYVKLSRREAFPRLTVVRAAKADDALYVGPLSPTQAQLVVDAIHTVVPLRRCAQRISSRTAIRDVPCTAAQLGVATCPCSGGISQAAYGELVATVVAGLTTNPARLLGPLHDRMSALAAVERFEEAADVRDCANALASALRRQQRLDSLRRGGVLRIRLPGDVVAELHGGVLQRTWALSDTAGRSGQLSLGLDGDLEANAHSEANGSGPTSQGAVHASTAADGPLSRHLADELACVASWLDSEAGRIRVTHCDGGLAMPTQVLPSFAPGPGLTATRR